MKIIKITSFQKVSGKVDCRFEFSVFVYILQHRSKILFVIVSIFIFLDIRSIKDCIIWMFRRLGTMLERFFKAKSFGLHISKPKKIPGNIFLTFRRSESRPAGTFSAKYFISCESKVACKFLKKVPECFKSRFDRLERQIASSAFCWYFYY